MCTVALGMVEPVHSWARARPWLPLALLAALAVLSLAARAAWLGAPCRSACRSAGDHLLIFDEDYYVNAARVIASEAVSKFFKSRAVCQPGLNSR